MDLTGNLGRNFAVNGDLPFISWSTISVAAWICASWL